jgi:hypothetical protein
MRSVTFPKDVLDLLARTAEVDIETRSSSGKMHRVPIWIVVDGETVLARSWRGATARWYRELMAHEGAVVIGRRRVPVRAVRAVDADSVRKTSDGFRKKYAKSKSTPSMLRDDILDTTIRLEPAG